jgi:hypothetical protein
MSKPHRATYCSNPSAPLRALLGSRNAVTQTAVTQTAVTQNAVTKNAVTEGGVR